MVLSANSKHDSLTPDPEVMRLECFLCGKYVSSEIPAEVILRAVVICPECFDKRGIPLRPREPNEPPEAKKKKE